MQLYRAANSTATEFTTCFAAEEDHAAFYLCNRPFGGSFLYRVTVPRPADGAVYRCAGADASECLISFLDDTFGRECREEVWHRNFAACVGSLLSEREGRSLIESFAAANPSVEWLVFEDSDGHGETWMSLRAAISASWEEIPPPAEEGFECAILNGMLYSFEEARECLADEPELRFEIVRFPAAETLAEAEAEMRQWQPVYVPTGRFVS